MKNDGKSTFRMMLAFALVLLMSMSAMNVLAHGDDVKTESVSAPSVLETGETRQTPQGGTLKIAMQDDIKTLNPLSASDVWTWNYLGWIFDGLISRDRETDELVPWMLEWWHYDESNPNHGVMKLREDIFWHDHVPGSSPGDPGYRQVTAQDIIFTYNLLKEVPRYMTGIEPIVYGSDVGAWNVDNDTYAAYESETVATKQSVFGDPANQDDYVIQIEMINPKFRGRCYANFVQEVMGLWPILPEHIWITHTGSDKESWDMDFNPNTHEAPGLVGCGAFSYGEWKPLQTARLDTFKEYFMTPANIDSMLFSIYGTTEAAVLALENGDVDYIAWTVPAGFIPQLDENPAVTISKTSELGFFYMTFNFRNPAFGYDSWDSSTRKDIGRPLREAIAHSVDKSTIVSRLLQNFGRIGGSAVSPANKEWHNDSVINYDFDPEKAKQILDAYDIKDKDGDGYRDGPGSTASNVIPIDGEGGDGEIEILTPPADYDPIRAAAGLMIADQLQAIGINARSAPTAFGQIVERMDALDFEMFILGWSIGSRDGSYMWDFFHSSQADPGEYNAPGYHNDSVYADLLASQGAPDDMSYDEIVDAMRTECNLEKRIVYNRWAQGIIAQDIAYDVLYYRDNLEAYRTDKFAGWVEREISGVFNWYTVMEMYSVSGDDTGGLQVSITELSSDIGNGGTDTFTVSVKDNNVPVSGAEVTLKVEKATNAEDAGNGTLSLYSGTTDDDGQIKDIIYTAPALEEGDNPKQVHIYATATVDTQTKNTQAKITVHPPGEDFIAVSIESPSGDIIDTGDTVQLIATVVNQDNAPVQDATVTVSASDEAAVFDKTEATTNADGQTTFSLTVSLGADQTEKVDVTITVSASAADYFNEPENSLVITVLPEAGDNGGGGILPTMGFIATTVVVALAAVTFAVIRWRRKK